MSLLLSVVVVSIGLDHRFWAGEPGMISMSVAEWLAYPTFVAFLLLVLASGRHTWLAVGQRIATANWGGSAYLAWAMLVALLSVIFRGNSEAFHHFKDMAPGLSIFICLAGMPASRHNVERIHSAVLIAVASVGCLALLQAAFGGPYLNPVDDNAYLKHSLDGVNLVRNPAVGTMGHPNAFSVFMTPLTILSVGWLLHRLKTGAGRVGTTVGFLGAGVAVTAIAVSQAKLAAAILTAALSVLLFTHSRDWPFTRRAGLILSLLFMFGAVGVVGIALLAGSAGVSSVDSGTLWTRFLLDMRAVHELQSTPQLAVLGGAAESFTAGGTLRLGVHNEYLREALLVGLPGALLFAAMLIVGSCGAGVGGWMYAAAIASAAALFQVEAAGGSQLLGMVFIVLGVTASANRAGVASTEGRSTQ